MKRRKQQEMEDVEMDMTPMIDVVFNLIIFFMLITQMVTIERAELELPRADKAEEERTEDKKQLVINIFKEPQENEKWIEVSGALYNWGELAQLLYEESQLSFNDSQGISERQVLVRADIDTPYRMVQRVMLECSKQKIYLISFAAKIQED